MMNYLAPTAILRLLVGTLLIIFGTQLPINAGQAPHQSGGLVLGLATFYSEAFQGDSTASGERFSNSKLVAAHPHFPIGSWVRVTNLANNRSVVVKIIDRGPTKKMQSRGIIIDLSRAAAEKLGFIKQGKTRVRLTPVDEDQQVAD